MFRPMRRITIRPIASPGRAARRKRRRLDGDPPGLQREIGRFHVKRVELGEPPVELLGEVVLLPAGIRRRERVLPLPDDDCPGQA